MRDEPWGLHVPAEEAVRGRNVMCVEVGEDAETGNIEGMIVLASPVERPKLETWMETLRLEPDGMLFSQARAALVHEVSGNSRGEVPLRSFTPEQRLAFRNALSSRPRDPSGPSLGLPGVEERAVECRVARK
jgi:hypothetical protein